MSDLICRDLCMTFHDESSGTRVEALKNINFQLKLVEILTVLGPSGCGKTTLLNMIAGFLVPTDGELTLGSVDIEGPGAERGMVFQQGALFEWLTVARNVDFGLRMRGEDGARSTDKVNSWLDTVGLQGFGDTPTYQLSGGMQQRVALARCLVNDPSVILMDEPLGALDALTREKMQSLILELWKKTGKTIIVITHSVEEALLLGERLFVMAPITAALPIRSRYLKSTTLVVRNTEQLAALEETMPVSVLGSTEIVQLETIIAQTRQLILIMSSPDAVGDAALAELADVEGRLLDLSDMLAGGPGGLSPSAEALAQPKWGTAEVEIPILPMTPRGVMFERVSADLVPIADQFLQIRNMSPEVESLIASTASLIAAIKAAEPQQRLDEAGAKQRNAYIKALERIFRRIDDATIFPAATMAGIEQAVDTLYGSVSRAKGGLGFVEVVFFPGPGVVKSRTQCTEQGSGRWLPKPSDVVATFSTLANPDIASGGGYKGTTLLWWK